MQINDILITDGEEEVRRLNIPSATIEWSGPYSFKEATNKSGGGLYIIVKKVSTPIYVGQTRNYKSRFRGRFNTLRQAACDMNRREVYLGSIILPRGGVKSRQMRLHLESVLIRSYLKRGHTLTNRSSIREL